MADGTSFSPEAGLPAKPVIENQIESKDGKKVGSKESLPDKQGISLYKSKKFNVFVPSKPNIPLNEGLHVEVSDGNDVSDLPKEVLARYTMALGSAKVLAESGLTHDAWANTRLEDGQKVSVYGRVPGVDSSWRKPVDTFNRNAPEINNLEPNYNTQKLQELFRRYLPRWEQLTENMSLFKNGVEGKDLEITLSKDEVPVWENDKFTLVVVSAPHLKGIHLVAHPKESFQRQWQTIGGLDQEQIHTQATLEATAIAMGAQKLLADGGGEIHNSGNWNYDLKTTDEGGKLNLQRLQEQRKMEKKLHRPDLASPENQISTGMHAHVYIPEEGPVILPEMSKKEALERGREDIVKQWEAIPLLNQVQLGSIKAKLGEGKLTEWLEENCRGKIQNK